MKGPDRTTLTVLSALCLLGLHLCRAALPTCTKVDDCSCKTPDGKEINIRSLGYQGSEAPRFKFDSVTGGPWSYAYNPCYAYTYRDDCTNIVACQTSPKTPSEIFGIGDAGATWTSDDSNYIIVYSHTDGKSVTRTSKVTLKCDESAEEPTLLRQGNHGSGTTYYFVLTSKCACPGTCQLAPTPTVAPTAGGLSVGSIMCIVFSVLLVLYVGVGVIFQIFVRHANGLDVIPNYNLWVGLIGYIKSGFLFVFMITCGKNEYDTMK